MTRSTPTFAAVPGPRDGSKGLPRERAFRLTDGSSALVRERLDTFAVAFLNDPQPALLYEHARLIFANDAARGLLASTSASGSFLESLEDSVSSGVMERGLLLRTCSGAYAPVLYPSRSCRGHPTLVCFLVKRSEASAAGYCEGLSERELEVVTLLVKGLTNAEIADELGISIETVRKHISHSLEKTGSKTRAGLVGRALGR